MANNTQYVEKNVITNPLDFIDPVDPLEFHFVSSKMRDFFRSKGFIEVAAQHRLSILAACEDPKSIATFNYAGNVYPLPQTSQMWLEHELLKNPSVPGFFSVSYSYRHEQNPKFGRHNLTFPMIEFELPGGFDSLKNFEMDMLEFLGYGPRDTYQVGNYLDVAKKYNVDDLDHDHEMKLYEEYGPVYFLCNFPESTSPFWNMHRNGDGTASKIDVIMHGFETIGSATRSVDVDQMRKTFHEISDGEYSGTLFNKFGKERVMRELDSFLENRFIERCGGGIGYNRLARSLKMKGILHN
jgi:aspartyl/asparaginyl-tRNA synthetase